MQYLPSSSPKSSNFPSSPKSSNFPPDSPSQKEYSSKKPLPNIDSLEEFPFLPTQKDLEKHAVRKLTISQEAVPEGTPPDKEAQIYIDFLNKVDNSRERMHLKLDDGSGEITAHRANIFKTTFSKENEGKVYLKLLQIARKTYSAELFQTLLNSNWGKRVYAHYEKTLEEPRLEMLLLFPTTKNYQLAQKKMKDIYRVSVRTAMDSVTKDEAVDKEKEKPLNSTQLNKVRQKTVEEAQKDHLRPLDLKIIGQSIEKLTPPIILKLNEIIEFETKIQNANVELAKDLKSLNEGQISDKENLKQKIEDSKQLIKQLCLKRDYLEGIDFTDIVPLRQDLNEKEREYQELGEKIERLKKEGRNIDSETTKHLLLGREVNYLHLFLKEKRKGIVKEKTKEYLKEQAVSLQGKIKPLLDEYVINASKREFIDNLFPKLFINLLTNKPTKSLKQILNQEIDVAKRLEGMKVGIGNIVAKNTWIRQVMSTSTGEKISKYLRLLDKIDKSPDKFGLEFNLLGDELQTFPIEQIQHSDMEIDRQKNIFYHILNLAESSGNHQLLEKLLRSSWGEGIYNDDSKVKNRILDVLCVLSPTEFSLNFARKLLSQLEPTLSEATVNTDFQKSAVSFKMALAQYRPKIFEIEALESKIQALENKKAKMLQDALDFGSLASLGELEKELAKEYENYSNLYPIDYKIRKLEKEEAEILQVLKEEEDQNSPYLSAFKEQLDEVRKQLVSEKAKIHDLNDVARENYVRFKEKIRGHEKRLEELKLEIEEHKGKIALVGATEDQAKDLEDLISLNKKLKALKNEQKILISQIAEKKERYFALNDQTKKDISFKIKDFLRQFKIEAIKTQLRKEALELTPPMTPKVVENHFYEKLSEWTKGNEWARQVIVAF